MVVVLVLIVVLVLLLLVVMGTDYIRFGYEVTLILKRGFADDSV